MSLGPGGDPRLGEMSEMGTSGEGEHNSGQEHFNLPGPPVHVKE